ncbi:MAG: hypothetical protein U0232_00455 [Thermomicrobiales bacterium]
MPNRFLSLWPYSDPTDPRLRWGNRIMLVRATPAPANKLGYRNAHGWLAHWLDGTLLVKSFPANLDARHPDNGCNAECYLNDQFMEVESLGGLVEPAPGRRWSTRSVAVLRGDRIARRRSDGAGDRGSARVMVGMMPKYRRRIKQRATAEFRQSPFVSRCLPLLLGRLNFQADLDRIADEDATGLQRHVPGEPEVAPADRRLGGEGGNGGVPGGLADANSVVSSTTSFVVSRIVRLPAISGYRSSPTRSTRVLSKVIVG